MRKRTPIDYILSLLAGGIMLSLALPASSDIEETLFPVARDISAKALTRTSDQVCWQFSFQKLRTAWPWNSSWSMQGRSEDGRATVWAFDPVTLRTMRRDETSIPANGIVTYQRCAIIPFHLRSEPKLYVDWSGSYDVWHGLWRVGRTIGPIEIDLPVHPTVE